MEHHVEYVLLLVLLIGLGQKLIDGIGDKLDIALGVELHLAAQLLLHGFGDLGFRVWY